MAEPRQHPEEPLHGTVPELSKGFLKTALLTPPALALLPASAHLFLPADVAMTVLAAVGMTGIPLILGLTVCFRDIVEVRYRGISLHFLVWSYLLGQCIGCVALLVLSGMVVGWIKGIH